MNRKKQVVTNPVVLTQDQQVARDMLSKKLGEIKEAIRNHKQIDVAEINELGNIAAKLHRDLSSSGVSIRHHSYMIKNRGIPPTHADFYKHIHPVEDLLSFLQDQDANKDPVDQTLNGEFSIEIYSRRWGHDDIYRFKRTKAGWHIAHMQEYDTGRDGRVGAREGTGLFALLDHDSINYPEELPGYLEYLWKAAAENGLSADQVKQALNELGAWVSTVERSSPGGIFEGYK